MAHEASEFEGVEVESAADFAGVPDAFQRLWTPHRLVYVQDMTQPVLLNLFPYNSGHLLVCPYRHVALYDEATDDEVAEIASLTQTAMRVLRATSHCDGFNLGMNQGEIAGAGIAAHLHQHIVPRWALDSNFFPIIAGTKAIPKLLGDVRREIAAAWPT